MTFYDREKEVAFLRDVRQKSEKILVCGEVAATRNICYTPTKIEKLNVHTR